MDKTLPEVAIFMAWVVLLLSGMLESVWAAALDASQGFSRLWPSVIFLVALTLSMAGLSFAMRSIPLGTAYAVWVGIGAVLTVAYAMLTGSEAVSAAKIVLIGGLIVCVVGLRMLE